MHFYDLTGLSAPEYAALATVLDGEATGPDVTLDPGCGPATATMALMSPTPVANWGRVDATGLTRFLASLPTSRWRAIGTPLELGLERVNAAELIIGLHEPQPTNEEPDAVRSAEVTASGTDADALDAATRLLEKANGLAEPVRELVLVNAVALLPSIPDGPARTRLDDAITEAFIYARRGADLEATVAGRPRHADRALETALRRLRPADAAELAVRLHPHVTRGGTAAMAAARMFRDLGLGDVAGLFGEGAEADVVSLPYLVTDPPASPAWLRRDLETVAQAEPSARGRLAGEILARNTATLPGTDLAYAQTVLERSRQLGRSLAQLIEDPGVEVTPP